jgi:hypothetical protein
MEQFKVSTEGITELKRKLWKRSLLIVGVSMAAGLFIAIKNDKEKGFDLTTTLITIPVLAVAYGIGVKRGHKRTMELLESYQLTITDNLITREQKNTPAIQIYKNEVAEIVRTSQCYYIKTKDKSSPIMVPVNVENREGLERLLNGIKPISSKADFKYSSKYPVILVLAVLGLMIAFFTATDKIIATATGVPLLAGIIYLQVEMKRNKNIDRKSRKGMLWVIVIGFAVVFKIVMLWAGKGY